ncbi:unnamed protein product [Amaranthus hypochondriacus]
MATLLSKTLALLLLNLLFFSLVSACGECGGGSPYTRPKPKPKPKHKPGTRPTPYPGSGSRGGGGYPGSGSTPSTGGGIPIIGGGGPIIGGGGPVVGGGVPIIGGGGPVIGGGGPVIGGGGPGVGGSCPMDALKLGVCANVLNGLLNVTLGAPPVTPCCPLLGGLVDAEVAVCLCTAIKANILGINLNIPVSLSLLVNYCGRQVPRGFQCP